MATHRPDMTARRPTPSTTHAACSADALARIEAERDNFHEEPVATTILAPPRRPVPPDLEPQALADEIMMFLVDLGRIISAATRRVGLRERARGDGLQARALDMIEAGLLGDDPAAFLDNLRLLMTDATAWLRPRRVDLPPAVQEACRDILERAQRLGHCVAALRAVAATAAASKAEPSRAAP